MKKKLISLLLCLVMCLSALPVCVLAEPADQPVSYVYYTGEGNAAVKHEGTCTDYVPVTIETNTLANGVWYVVNEDVTKSSGITVNGEAHLILLNGKTLTVGDGIIVNSGNTLNIYAQRAQEGTKTGALIAKGEEYSSAAIGGGQNHYSGNIKIHGGNITATGSYGGAGIGGSAYSNGYSVTIFDGTVNAYGGKGSAGIGGGWYGTGGTTIINGGTVNATGGDESAAIGGNIIYGDGGTVIINGGTVTATGRDTLYGKAIGNCTLTLGDGVTFEAGSSADNITIYGNKNSAGNALGQTYFATPHVCVFDQESSNEDYLKSAATCTEAAVYYKSCKCGEEGAETFTSGNASGHTYGTPSYVWNGDKCAATRTCSVCAEGTVGHTETETATATYVKDTDATCLASETGHYSASFSNTAFTSQQTAKDSVTKGAALGHKYSAPSYVWDGDKCTATRTCSVCAEGTVGHTETEIATATYVKDTDATCLASETGHYSASFNNTAFAAQQTAKGSVAKGKPLGHEFPNTWEQYNAEQHKRICTRCKTEVEYNDHSFDGNTCTICGYMKGNTYTIIEGANGNWKEGSNASLSFTSDAPFRKFVCVKVDGNTIGSSNYTAVEGSTKITLASAYLKTLRVGKHSIDVVSTDGTASTSFTVNAAVPASCTVSFNMNGHGTQVASQSVAYGSKATKPADPKASGYTFGGWYADTTCSVKFDFNSAITADTTVYAKWTKNVAPINPRTGDSSNMLLWIALLFVSGGALAGTTVYGKKRRAE